MDMTTNTDCTVIRLADGEDPVYLYVPAVMWQDVYAQEVKKYGAENADSAAIYFPDVDTDVRIGDFVVMGGVDENVDPAVICGAVLRITSVAVNRYGSRDMQHIKAGAK